MVSPNAKSYLIVKFCLIIFHLLCFDRTLIGHTDILVYASEIQTGCKIIANGTSTADSRITIEFGRGSCNIGKNAALNVGSIFIGKREFIKIGRSYKGKAMCDCLTITCRPIHFSPDTSHAKMSYLP